MNLAQMITAIAVVVPFAACPADEPRKPIPDEVAQKKAEATLKDLFKADFAKTKPPDRKALAGKLLKLAGEEKDSAGRFVLLREVRDITAQLGDYEEAQRTLRTMAAEYQIDEVEELVEVIRSAFKVSNLSRGDLKILAAGEIAKPTDSKPALELAEAWSVCAEQEKGRTKSLLLGRATNWYASAANDISISVLTKKRNRK